MGPVTDLVQTWNRLESHGRTMEEQRGSFAGSLNGFGVIPAVKPVGGKRFWESKGRTMTWVMTVCPRKMLGRKRIQE